MSFFEMFWYQENTSFIQRTGKCSLYFRKRLWRVVIISSLKCLVEITSEVILAWSFLCETALIMSSISLIIIALVSVSTTSGLCLVICILWGICHFIKVVEIIATKLFIIFCYYPWICNDVSSFFFLVLIICVFSFALISLARGLSILLKFFQESRFCSIGSFYCLLIFCYTDFCF